MTTVVLNIKIGKVERRISDTSWLLTTAVLNTKIGEVENKIPDVICLFKKKNHDYIEKKYFTTSNYNKFKSEILDSRIKQKELVNKSSFSNLMKNSNF